MSDQIPEPEVQDQEPKSFGRKIVAGLLGVGAVAYLAFPSLLPDVIPIVGALDEVAATTILMSCLAYLGLNIPEFLGRSKSTEVAKTNPNEKVVEGEVIDS